MNKNFSKTVLDYTKNKFNTNIEIPTNIHDEPFIEAFEDIIDYSKNVGITKALNEKFPHGDENIIFKNEADISLEIYNSIAGNIPIFYAKNPEDFATLVNKLIYKGKGEQQLESVGASFAHGKNIRFIILSNKPYSNIPAESISLSDDLWKKYSMIIRREHECTHYFTKRFLGSSHNNIHDELIADFAGIVSATNGVYHPDWFLKGMGIDKFPKTQPEGRFPVYTKELISQDDLDAVKEITINAAYNVKNWSDQENVKKLPLTEKILFLCKNSLLDLCDMN